MYDLTPLQAKVLNDHLVYQHHYTSDVDSNVYDTMAYLKKVGLLEIHYNKPTMSDFRAVTTKLGEARLCDYQAASRERRAAEKARKDRYLDVALF